MGIKYLHGVDARYENGKSVPWDWEKDKYRVKKGFVRFLGFLLVMPAWLFVIIPIAGMIANRTDYEKWLFEKNIFPALAWCDGSYIKAIILWFGAVAVWLVYVWLTVKCFTYNPKKSDA